MAGLGSTGRRTSLALMLHAILATRPRTAAEAEACNLRLSRARDFLMHATATAVLTLGGPLTAAEVDELRPEALADLRATCGACGLCAQFGRDPP